MDDNLEALERRLLYAESQVQAVLRRNELLLAMLETQTRKCNESLASLSEILALIYTIKAERQAETADDADGDWWLRGESPLGPAG